MLVGLFAKPTFALFDNSSILPVTHLIYLLSSCTYNLAFALLQHLCNTPLFHLL